MDYKDVTLERCPFCGGEAKAGIKFGGKVDSGYWVEAKVYCSECFIEKTENCTLYGHRVVPMNDLYKAYIRVVNEWNMRYTDDDLK